MRRFSKRLLTGVLSGAMALSLFPVTGFGTYDAKAAINPALLPQDSEGWILPGGRDGIHGGMYDVWSEEEQRNYPTEITGVTIPKEYQGYVAVEREDFDNDGVVDEYGLQTRSYYDEQTGASVSLADEKQDSVGMDIPVTVDYRLESGYNGQLTHTIHITNSVYDHRVYSSIGTDWVIPGQSFEVQVDITHRVAEWNDEGWYFQKNVDLVKPTYGVSLTNHEDDRITLTPSNGNTFLVSARDLREGEEIEQLFGEAGADVILYEDGKETYGFWYQMGVDREAYGLLPCAFTGIKNLKIGEEYNFKPVVTRYSYDDNREGQAVEGVSYDIFDVDENVISVNKNDDGSYTVTRKEARDTSFGLKAHFKDTEGRDVNKGSRAELAELGDINATGITADDDLFIVFADTKSRTFTVDTSKLDSAIASGYELEWKVGKGYWANGFVFTDEFTEGVNVAADGKSVSLDGTKLVKYFPVRNNNGFEEIDGDDRFVVRVSVKMPGTEESIPLTTEEVKFKLPFVDYNDLVNDDPDWVRSELLLPGDVFYLDNFYYYVENDANPKGRYVPFDINVKSVARYEGDKPDTSRVTPIEYKEVNGRPAVKVIDNLPPGADQNDLFGESRVDFTFTDAYGSEQSGRLLIFSNDYDDEAVVDVVDVSGENMVDKDTYGNYHVDTLLGETVYASVYVVARQYNRETGEVEVSYPEVTSFAFDKGRSDMGVTVKSDKGIYAFTGDNEDKFDVGIDGDFVCKYMTTFQDEDGNQDVNLMEARTYFAVNFRSEMEVCNDLELSKLNEMKTIEWTPSMTIIGYGEEEGKFVAEDSTNWHRYGFVYDPETVSVTVNGKEIGDDFSEGPFTITSKSDRVAKIRLVKADYDDFRDMVRYTGNANVYTVNGIIKDKVHNDHIWTETEGVKAGIGKAGKVVRTCDVGGETVIEMVPAIESITLNKTVLAYTGANQTVKVTVKDTEGNVISPEHYTVTNTTKKNAGTYKVVVTFDSYKYEGTKTLTYTIKKPVLKYRAYVQKKNWMTFQTADLSSTPNTKIMAGTTDNLRMETIQMQLSGVKGEIRYRAYCQKKGWTGVGTETGGWATTANKNTNAGTKGQSLRVEMIQLQAKGEVSNLYDIYYQAYSEKFGWLAWAGNNEKAGSAGYAYKLEAFRVQLVPKGAKFDKTKGASKKKSFYDKTKDGANPK